VSDSAATPSREYVARAVSEWTWSGVSRVEPIRVLRDQSIIVPQDQAVWELLAKWCNAPSNTASADLPEKP
jgi:hypothetical protein